MSLSQLLDHVALSDQHLAEAEERISQQFLRVAASVGVERGRAAALLFTYLESLEQMQIHRSV